MSRHSSLDSLLKHKVVASCVAAETLLALVLGLLFINRHSLWLDEAVSVRLAKIPWPAFWDMLGGREANSAAYFVMLRAWVSIGGDSEAWVRSLSAVAFAATVPGLYSLGRRLFGQKSGLLAGLLFALAPAGIASAQEARGFAVETFLLVYAGVFFVRAATDGGARRWLGWVALSGLATWVHLLAVLAPLAFVLALVVARRRAPAAAILGLAAIGLSATPLIYLGYMGGQGGLGFLRGRTFANATRLPLFLTGWSYLLLACLALAMCVSIVQVLKAGRARDNPDWFPIWFPVAWLCVPVLTALLISMVKPIFNNRYFVYEIAPLILLASAAVQFLPKFAAIVSVITSVAISSAAVTSVYQRPPMAEWRAATRMVMAAATSTDGIIFNPTFERIPYQYYMDAEQPRGTPPRPIVPSDPWGPLPVEDYAAVQRAIDDPAQLFQPGQRVWVVGRGGSTAPDVVSATGYLKDKARLSLDTRLPGVTVRLFVLPE